MPVKASFEFLKEKSICPVPLTKKIKSIEVVNDYSVKFVLTKPPGKVPYRERFGMILWQVNLIIGRNSKIGRFVKTFREGITGCVKKLDLKNLYVCRLS